jgi:hypothetical protein
VVSEVSEVSDLLLQPPLGGPSRTCFALDRDGKQGKTETEHLGGEIIRKSLTSLTSLTTDPIALGTARRYLAGLADLGATLFVTTDGLVAWRPQRGVLTRDDKRAIVAHQDLLVRVLGGNPMQPFPLPTTPAGDRVAVVGSRPRCWPEPAAVRAAVEALVDAMPDGTTVVTGGADGVDAWAEGAARRRGLSVAIHPADRQRHGRRAGYVRNVEIVEDADRVVAFHGVDPKTERPSGGTAITVGLAGEAGKLDRVVTWDEIAATLPVKPAYTARQAALVADVRDRARRLAAARTPQARGALLRTMTGPVDVLRAEVVATADWLSVAWAWLDGHQNRPDATKHEERYLGVLCAYEGMSDALREATEALPCS